MTNIINKMDILNFQLKNVETEMSQIRDRYRKLELELEDIDLQLKELHSLHDQLFDQREDIRTAIEEIRLSDEAIVYLCKTGKDLKEGRLKNKCDVITWAQKYRTF